MASIETSAPIVPPLVSRSAAVSSETAWSIAVAAIVALLCLAAGSSLLNDPDTQWHVAAGRWMIENAALPRTDTMSHTFAVQPWIAKEWLSQLVLAAAYKAGGWPLVASLPALALALAAFMIMSHVGRRSGQPAGLVMAAVAFMIVASAVVARPHVLVFPLVVGWTICLLTSAETTRRPPWHALPLLALWANMHAGFTIGFVVAAAFGLEALLRAPPQERVATALRWLGFGLACLVMGLATPYGAEPLLLNLTMAAGNEAIPFIGEWRSLPATPRSGAILVLAGLGIYLLARQSIANAGRVLLLCLITWMMVRHERFVMSFGLVAPLLAGPLIWQWASDVCRRLEIFQGGMDLPPAITAHRAAAVLAALALGVVLSNRIALPAQVAPVAALAAVPAELREQRVFNSYNLGGFLAGSGIRTFIDGRTDQLFLGGFITRVEKARTAAQPALLAALLDQYGVEWAIVAADMPEARLFAGLDGWRALYKDQAAHVWVRAPR